MADMPFKLDVDRKVRRTYLIGSSCHTGIFSVTVATGEVCSAATKLQKTMAVVTGYCCDTEAEQALYLSVIERPWVCTAVCQSTKGTALCT